MKKYRIRDLQFDCRYFAGGKLFESLKDVCEQLIDYHEADCIMEVEKELLEKGKIEECWEQLSCFEWGLEEVKNYQFAVKATDKHDEEIAEIEAESLEEAKRKFKESFPEDVDNITVITSDEGYEEFYN
jgi:hypothetical protein